MSLDEQHFLTNHYPTSMKSRPNSCFEQYMRKFILSQTNKKSNKFILPAGEIKMNTLG